MKSNSLGCAFASTLVSKKVKKLPSRRVKAAFFGAMVVSSSTLGAVHTVSAGLFDTVVSIVNPTWGFLSKATIGALNILKFALPLGTETVKSWFFYKMYAQGYVQQLIPKKEYKKKTLLEVKSELDVLLKSVIGQEKAKVKIKNSILHLTHMAQNKEKMPPIVFYFSGPTGCGKDHTIEKVIAPIFGDSDNSVFYFDASSIDPNSDIPVGDQIFGYQLIGGSSKNAQMCISPVIDALSRGCKVIVFDELDKIIMKNGRTAAECMDEKMRTILDKGKIYIPGGREIDCRGVVFCFTTNEHPDCLSKVKNFEDIDVKKLKDPTGSHTYGKHDKSYICRKNFIAVIMEQLKGKDLYDLCKAQLLDMILDFYFSYGIQLYHEGNFENICKAIAQEAEKRNEGARGVGKIINEMIIPQVLQKAVMPFISNDTVTTPENDDENDKEPKKVHIGKNFILSYDPDTGTFDCSLYKVRQGLIIPLKLDEKGDLLPTDPNTIIRLKRQPNADDENMQPTPPAPGPTNVVPPLTPNSDTEPTLKPAPSIVPDPNLVAPLTPNSGTDPNLKPAPNQSQDPNRKAPVVPDQDSQPGPTPLPNPKPIPSLKPDPEINPQPELDPNNLVPKPRPNFGPNVEPPPIIPA